jgi:hypothetical protein
MMHSGYVYIFDHSSMEGLVKVGCTEKLPEERARDLFTTSVPDPFRVVWKSDLLDDMYAAEQAAHKRLSNFRKNPKREFFKISIDRAIAEVSAVVEPFLRTGSDRPTSSSDVKIDPLNTEAENQYKNAVVASRYRQSILSNDDDES